MQFLRATKSMYFHIKILNTQLIKKMLQKKFPVNNQLDKKKQSIKYSKNISVL